MSEARTHIRYPRALREKELQVLEFVLPEIRSGYKHYRELIRSMVVLGEGRRGKGNLVLGFEDDVPDTTSPLASVVAYGVVETTRDRFTITVREYVGEQIDVEIVSGRGGEIPDYFEEKGRWTYSTWQPGDPSPATMQPVREVRIHDNYVLAIARQEKRIWLHERTTGMNLLIPITNFYNELMLHMQIRDPQVALKADLFFTNLSTYSDDAVMKAFIAYNKVKPKVVLPIAVSHEEEGGLGRLFKRLFSKKS
ncbi:MAG: hypothetical protein HY708_05575 [Ignavibacteriae bacterium]|nr:hypothetical protein [Ignavibacteriota bacterium]